MKARFRVVLSSLLIPLTSIIVGWMMFMLSAIAIMRLYERKPQASEASDLARFTLSVMILASWLFVWHRLTQLLRRRLIMDTGYTIARDEEKAASEKREENGSR